MTRIYLDNAATSFPKPESVYVAMDDYNRRLGVAVGRSGSRRGVELQSTVSRCRKLAADLLGAESADRIVFTLNCTDSLNQAMHGILRPNDHVVTTSVEHNSVVRPLRTLEQRIGLRLTHVAADNTGTVRADEVANAVQPDTRLVVVTHASNVTGAIQPIADIAETAHKSGALILVDAAQTAGHIPIDVAAMQIDMLACAGHKGLLGPLGTGLLYIRPDVDELLVSTRQGGTGTQSEHARQPDSMPEKLESGNHNAPGLCGLAAALAWLTEYTIASAHRSISDNVARMLDGLQGIDNIRIYAAPTAGNAGVISFRIGGLDPHDVSLLLEQTAQIETRAGLHCAPDAHRTIGTFAAGGTTRIGIGPFTTTADIDACVAAVQEIARMQV